jgi:hypothetical protein
MRKKIKMRDKFQSYSYELTQPEGKHFDPEFKPDLTPKQMLELGVFGGHYFVAGTPEFPKSWFAKARLNPKKTKDPEYNFFHISASMPLSYWQKKGWIHPDDPHGWFQWYCRYHWGRRHQDDDRQIRRWKQMKRHVGQIKANCDRGDLSCREKQRQAMLHWAYDSRKM